MKDTLIQHIDKTQSTNKLLSSWVDKRADTDAKILPFFALWADFQTAGRGMGANHWFSDAGKNLLVSFYFEPGIPAERQFLFNQYFSVCTRDFIAQYADDVAIKWPNDIYIGGKKVAGILIEHTLSGGRIAHTIAGIGVNINQECFPEDIPHPTSLLLETGKTYDICSFLESYRHWLQQHYGMLQTDEASALQLKERYMSQLFQRGERRPYLIHGEQREAVITDIDDFGRLQLEDISGKLHTCGTKEVVFL
ncbi:MAG: biotin--[acetyl-CoA-carboxylase] ligase [Bacteroidales bacterium]|nr:biotin--[acetyl-CoA-carboxylase] ligase [Bacteroidales bacterium]